MQALVGFIVVTAAEVAGLAAWLWLARDGQPFWGFGALVAGEAIEWALLAFLIARSPASTPLREGTVNRALVLTALTSLAEAGLWVTWLSLSGSVGWLVATAMLLVSMHLKHGVDVTVFTGRSYWPDLMTASAATATVWEVGGAATWLLLTLAGYPIAGIAVLGTSIAIEHFLQFRSAGLI